MTPIPLRSVLDPVDPQACGFSAMHRVLWKDKAANSIVTIALEPKLRAPIEGDLSIIQDLLDRQLLRIVQISPRPMITWPEDKIPERWRKIRDSALKLIKDLVKPRCIPRIYYRRYRKRMVKALADKLHCHPKQIHRPLYRYWAEGQKDNVLLPHYDCCGPQGDEKARRQKPTQAKRGPKPRRSIRRNDPSLVGMSAASVMARIAAGIARFYVKERLSKARAYRLTIDTFFNRGYRMVGGKRVPIRPKKHQAPTNAQFYREIELRDRHLKLSKKRIESSTWALKCRGSTRSALKKVVGPGTLYEIDATVLDIYLVSAFNRKWIIGRPVLYVVVDVFSSMVVGWYLGLEGPSWEGARLALFNAFTDKVAVCKDLGVNISRSLWPTDVLPQKVRGDRAEMLSKASDQLARHLGITVLNPSRRRADWKPFVECYFRLIDDEVIEFLPGEVTERLEEVARRKYPLDATLNIQELNAILAGQFIKANTTRFLDRKLPPEMVGENLLDATPLSIWNWGIENLTGFIERHSEQEVYTALLPECKVSIQGNGVRHKGLTYTSDRAEKEDWFAAKRIGRKKPQLDARHIPFNPGVLLVRPPGENDFLPFRLTDHHAQFELAREEEIVDRAERLKDAKEDKADEVRQDESAWDAHAKAIVDTATAEAKAARSGVSERELLTNIHAHRSFEKQAIRVQRRRGDEARLGAATQGQPRSAKVLPFPTKPKRRDPIDDLWRV